MTERMTEAEFNSLLIRRVNRDGTTERLCSVAHAEITALTARVKELEKALTDVGSSLVAAISLLEGGGKKAAPSDKMFRVMLSDYRKSVKRARVEDGGVRE